MNEYLYQTSLGKLVFLIYQIKVHHLHAVCEIRLKVCHKPIIGVII